MAGSLPTGTQVLVIGGGPGGYAAAIRAAQLGCEVTLVERDALGGVCLNAGCIPSKALISVAHAYHRLQQEAQRGLQVEGARVDVPQMQAWKAGVVQRLRDGVRRLLEGYGIRVLSGEARFLSPREAQVLTPEGAERLEFRYAIVATGSRPASLPGLDFDGYRILDSTAALNLDTVPEALLVVGGGYIGLELGTAWAKLGSRVTVVEALDRLLPGADPELGQAVERRLRRLGVQVRVRSRLEEVREQEGRLVATLRVQEPQGPRTETVVCDRILVAVGRKPCTDGLGLEEAGVERDPRGFILVDAQRRTRVPHLFAVGDAAGEPMLAHKAMKEGIVAAEAIAGQPASFDVRAIPAVVFTDPEIAYVGLTEEEARQKGYEVRVGRFPFQALGRALASGEAEGFVKIVADRASGTVLGGQIAGPGAAELIGELALAVELAARLEDLGWTIHPHPTYGEAIMEAAEAALGRAIHVRTLRTAAR